MRICFVSHGQLTHTDAYLQYFRSAGHDVHFVSLTPSPEKGVPTHEVGFGTNYSSTAGKWKYPFSMLRARRLIRRLQPDIVHTHYATSGGLTGLVCNFHPTVVTVHGTDLTVGIRSRIWRALLRAVFNHADCINTVSEDLKSMVLSLGAPADRIEVFTLGVDTEKFCFLERPVVSKDRMLKLVCTRHLWPQYDHHTIVEALALLKKEGIAFQMTVVGDGPLLSELEQKVQYLGLVDNVSFVGRIDNDNMPEALHKHDVYLSASLRDGTSLSLLEAMATGLFPIVSDIKTNSSWVENGVNGFLHRVAVPEDLARCISELCQNPQLAVSAAKRNRSIIVESGDRRTNMRRLEGIYRSLISGHRAG